MLICDPSFAEWSTKKIRWDPLSDRVISNWVLADSYVLRFKKKLQSAKKLPHILIRILFKRAFEVIFDVFIAQFPAQLELN